MVEINWYKEYIESCRCLWDLSRRFDWLFLYRQLQNQVKSIRKVFSEILEYLDKLDDAISDSNSDSNRYEYINMNEYPRTIMYFLFCRIINLITKDGRDSGVFYDDNRDLLVHVYYHFISENSELAHNTSASVLLHQSNHGSTVLTS